MVEIIPQKAINYLPFSSEPFSVWGEKPDLLEFLFALHDKSGVILSSDGTRTPVNYREYGKYVFESGKEDIKYWMEQFVTAAKNTTPAPGSTTQKVEIPDFSRITQFGQAAKYFIAWRGVVGEALQEGVFFSIEHVLESEADLECSVHLVANLYYKQALQVLRNFLEDLVLPIHLCDNIDDFMAWKSNDYYMPRLRGRNGLLQELVKKEILPSDIADEIGNLYGTLSGCIHGAERRLLHKGLYSGKWIGKLFKHSDFLDWCKYFCQAVDLGIRLLRININQWQAAKSGEKRFCSVCHNIDGFDTKRYEFGGEWHIEYRCPKCGNKMTFKDSSKK